MIWLVLAALRTELRPVLRLLRPRPRRVAGRPCHERGPLVFAVAGVGPAAAGTAASQLADALKPDVLVSTGFAGAIAADFETGDLILGGIPDMPASEPALRTAREAAPDARTGSVVAVDRVLRDAGEKERRHRESGAPAVDMESAVVARAARECGAGFLCAKVVLDTPAAPLACDYAGVLPVLGRILRRPKTVCGIRADAKRARIAAERLGAFYVRLADRLENTGP